MEICELVPSQKGNYKINVYGYLMVKERTNDNTAYLKNTLIIILLALWYNVLKIIIYI